jgi:hypothetical protein
MDAGKVGNSRQFSRICIIEGMDGGQRAECVDLENRAATAATDQSP